MSYFIIIRGPLGSGKTTLSEKLSEVLPAEHIKIDDVLEKLKLDKVPSGAPCIPAKNFIKANETVIPSAITALENGKIVIFDGCFYHKEAIEHLLENLPFPHHVFTLKVPLEVCIERDSKREKTYGEGAAWVVHKLVSQFDYGMVLDVNKSLKESLKEIQLHLAS